MATQTADPIADNTPVQAAPDAVVVRFAGDSGDGMQLTGGQFTLSTALAGNDLATFPDFPAEIRAPRLTAASAPLSAMLAAMAIAMPR